tara:strand:- start:905 stop:3145 length:2241 start_codon:yes stop_codon:yes gene_type:complete
MAVLSSLLGFGTPQQTVPAQQMLSGQLAPELAPFYKDILGKAQALYQTKEAEGFQPYTGPTIAQFTPEQEQAFTGLAGLSGTTAPQFEEARTFTKAAAAPVTTEEIEERMSPYQQAVVDIEKREAQKQFEQNVLPKIRQAQIAAGSFGGTRGTLLESQALADQSRALADIQARGSAAAFDQAMQALGQERARTGQAGTQLGALAPSQLQTGLREVGALQSVGEARQKQTQAALDEAYQQFIQEQERPYQTLDRYSAIVRGMPTPMVQRTPIAPAPTLGQTLLGAAGTAGSLYGAFGGFSPTGLFGMKGGYTGGGIADLPVVRRQVGGGLNVNSDSLMKYDDAAFIDTFIVPKRPPGMSGANWDRKYKKKGFKAGDKLGRYRVTSTGKEDIRPLKYIKSDVQKITSDPETASTPGAYGALTKYASSIKPGDTSVSALENLLANQQAGLGDLKSVIGEKAELAERMKGALGKLPTTEQADEETKKFFADKAARAQQQDEANIEASKREQFGNLAQFFTRLGTATPRVEGLGGLVDVGLRAADETIPQAMQTQRALQEKQAAAAEKQEAREDKQRAETLSNKTKDLEKLQAEYSLLEKKGASASALAKAETDILQALAEIETLKATTDVNIGELMPKDLTKTEDRLKALTTGRIIGDVPGFEMAQNAALLQAQTEVESALNDIRNKGGSGALRQVSKAQVEAAILGRAQDLLAEGGRLSRVTDKRQSNVKQTDSSGSAEEALDKEIGNL